MNETKKDSELRKNLKLLFAQWSANSKTMGEQDDEVSILQKAVLDSCIVNLQIELEDTAPAPGQNGQNMNAFFSYCEINFEAELSHDPSVMSITAFLPEGKIMTYKKFDSIKRELARIIAAACEDK